MKFGKRIQRIAQENSRFQAYFVDYKSLKKFLKRIARKDNPSESDDEDAEDAEEGFVLALESEVAKVESFFRSSLAEMLHDFRSLCKKISRLHLETRITEEFNGFDQLQKILEGTKEAALLQEFVAFSKEVDLLRKFVMTNAQATVKITKKHDKVTSGAALRERYVAVLQRCTFYNSRDFGALIADIEVLAHQLVEKLTGKQASPDDFQCPICMHVLSNPLVLSCGHRFCNSCISIATYFRQLNCPVCRKDIVMDFKNLKVNSLLNRFVREFHHDCAKKEGANVDDHACAGTNPVCDGPTQCVLESPCAQCVQWRSVHSQSCQPFLRRRSVSQSQDVSDTFNPTTRLRQTTRPWTACVEIFRNSSKNILTRIRSGSDIWSQGNSPSAPKDDGKDLTWSRIRDLDKENTLPTLSRLGILILVTSLALAAGYFLPTHVFMAEFQPASLPKSVSGIPLQLLKAPDTGAGKCDADKSGLEKLQAARTKSLHKALDNLVSRSSKK